MERLSRCRSCRAPIRWATIPGGKKIPLDPEPDAERGNVYLASGRPLAVTFGPLEADTIRRAGRVRLYRSHFATCPNAEEHRRPGRRP